MEIKFKGERDENWLKDTVIFGASNVLYSLALMLLNSPLSFLEILFGVSIISTSVYLIHKFISFFTYNKFEFKWNKNKEEN